MSAGIGLFNINAQSAAAGIVGADNGLNIDAPHATIVYLGGALLEDTLVSVTGFSLAFNSETDGSFQSVIGDTATGQGSVNINNTEYRMAFVTGDLKKEITGTDDGNGNLVTDEVDEIGLKAAAEYMGSGTNPVYKTDPQQYMTRFGVPAFIQTFDPQGNSGDINITSFPVDPAFDWIMQLNIYMLITVAGLGVNVNLTYTDIAGNPQTKLVISGVTADSYEGTVITFKAQRGTTVSLDTVTSGSNTYDVGGAFCILNPNL